MLSPLLAPARPPALARTAAGGGAAALAEDGGGQLQASPVALPQAAARSLEADGGHGLPAAPRQARNLRRARRTAVLWEGSEAPRARSHAPPPAPATMQTERPASRLLLLGHRGN